MMEFQEQKLDDFTCHPFTKIAKEWMLISSGSPNHFNTMTASWGGLGTMWGKSVAFTFIRPQRYTKEFIDQQERFSLCFFDKRYQKTLSYLGSVSGRDENKIETCDLTPMFLDGVPCFEEANCILLCKKLYCQEMLPTSFLDTSLDTQWYPHKDYHFMYVSEIEKVLQQI